MNDQKRQNKQGFTIIEVVLVLAIAALIFLMVFIALPALQRNQRDTQRKDDVGRLMTAVNNYQSNNRGKLPDDQAAWDDFKDTYLKADDAGGNEFTDPSGEGDADGNYILDVTDETTGPNWDDDPGVVFVNMEATCDGESINTGQGSRKVAFRIALEGGGVYCQSN